MKAEKNRLGSLPKSAEAVDDDLVGILDRTMPGTERFMQALHCANRLTLASAARIATDPNAIALIEAMLRILSNDLALIQRAADRETQPDAIALYCQAIDDLKASREADQRYEEAMKTEATQSPTPQLPDITPPLALPQNATEMEPYDKWRVVAECKGYMSQSAEAMLEAGKRLKQLRDNEPHGEFIRIAEQELGLEIRTAQRMMKAAEKFMGAKLSGPNATALSHLGKTKLFELMSEDDEELADLAAGGTLAGRTLDDIDRMTSRELKAALRKDRAARSLREIELEKNLEAARKAGEDYAKALREANEKLHHQDLTPLDRQQEKAIEEMKDSTRAIYARIGSELRGKFAKVADTHRGDYSKQEEAKLFLAQSLGQIIHLCKLISMEYEVNPQESPDSPYDFMTPAETMVAAGLVQPAQEG